MTDILKQVGISVAVVVVALLLTGGRDATPGIGGVYELTKQTFSAGIEVDGVTALENATVSNSITVTNDVTVTDDLTVGDDVTFGSASATSSATFGKTCWTITTNTGSTTYVSFVGTGTTVRMSTSTTSCN